MKGAAAMLGGELVLCLAHVEEDFAIFEHHGTGRLGKKCFQCGGDSFDRLHRLRGGCSWRHSRTVTHLRACNLRYRRRGNLQRKLEVEVTDPEAMAEGEGVRFVAVGSGVEHEGSAAGLFCQSDEPLQHRFAVAL